MFTHASVTLGRDAHLIKRIEQVRKQRGPRTGIGQGLHQPKAAQIANEAIGGSRRERQGEPPEIPLEGDDGHGGHTGPDHGESRLSTRQPGVEKAQAGDHDHDHGGGGQDIGLVAGLEPFVEVFGSGVAAEFVGGEGVVVGGSTDPVVGGVVGGVLGHSLSHGERTL